MTGVPDAALGAAAVQRLLAAAQAAREQAYAPYSRFKVGAALLDEQGRVYAGCNVENAAYPQGLCAEAGALAALVLAGGRRLRAALVVGEGAALCTPCGGCRQRLAEFTEPSTKLYLCDETGVAETVTMGDMLPYGFRGDILK